VGVARQLRILNHLFEGRHRRSRRAMKPPGARQAAQLLAERCTVEAGEEPTRGELVTGLLKDWRRPELDDVRSFWIDADGHPDVDGFLRELAEVSPASDPPVSKSR